MGQIQNLYKWGSMSTFSMSGSNFGDIVQEAFLSNNDIIC